MQAVQLNRIISFGSLTLLLLTFNTPMSTLSLDSNSLNSRITVIDALRGFTLLGIIITHMVEQYYAGPLPEKYNAQASSSVVDMIATGFSWLLINGKFYAIFSFLFGLSFYIQLSKAKADAAFILKFSWRLITLFAIGLIHHLHYRGDILTIYAMLGFVLLITYRLPDKYLLILSLLLIFDIPGVLVRTVAVASNNQSVNSFLQQDQTKLNLYYETFKNGTYLDLISANFESFKVKMDFQVWSGRIYMTPGLFLLGLYAGRKRFFETIQVSVVKKYLRNSAWGLLATVLVAVAFFVVGNGATGGLSQDTNTLAGLSFFNFFNTFLAAIYVSWFILLFQKEKWKRRLMQFYAAGRMGLTTYLMQALAGISLFSTLGFSLIGELGAATCFVIAVVIYILQIWFAKFWMTHFYYGPVEWLWRSLTNFKLQPFLKHKMASPLVASENQA
jgi:uncharacterized protein